MPKIETPALRRRALVEAAIAEIGAHGSLDVTVAALARRAGVSAALAHHYFGSKEQIFLAAMRHVLGVYGAEVRGALAMAEGPRSRLEAIVRAGFAPSNFRPEVIAAWLSFWALSRTSPEAARLLAVYQRRLGSNLRHALRPLAGARAPALAERIGGLIDGLYLRQGLAAGTGQGRPPDGRAAAEQVLAMIAAELG
jgi:TetR/AcrR family transcriptional repressor of bet genes